MIVTRTSIMSGKAHQMDLPITQAQIAAYNRGTLVQDAFPNLSPEEREFLMTGVTPEEWHSVFGSEDDA